MEYVKSSFIRKKFDVSAQTLQKWADNGNVKSIKIKDTNRRLFNYQSFLDYVGVKDQENFKIRKKFCYARVSSSHQKEDLVRQIEFLKKQYPEHEIIKDIGSGLNWKRKGFLSILEQVIDGNVEEIVVTHQDRLSRFSFGLLHWLFQKFDCKLLVLDKITETNPEIEISQDVLSVINYFVAKNNGQRSAKNRKKRNIQIQENKTLSNDLAKTDS